MKFSRLDFSGDVSVTMGDECILIDYKDLQDKETLKLVEIIKKSKLKIYKTETKDQIKLTGKDIKKAIKLFLEAQVSSLKGDEFMFIVYKDGRKEITTKKEAKLNIDELKEMLKIPVKPKAGCGEDKVKVKKALDKVDSIE